MINNLQERKKKINSEIKENQKNPEIIATTKGQNIQNLENTKKRNEELEEELISAEKRFNEINNNIRNIQEKLANLRENKARNEATLEVLQQEKRFVLFY